MRVKKQEKQGKTEREHIKHTKLLWFTAVVQLYGRQLCVGTVKESAVFNKDCRIRFQQSCGPYFSLVIYKQSENLSIIFGTDQK